MIQYKGWMLEDCICFFIQQHLIKPLSHSFPQIEIWNRNLVNRGQENRNQALLVSIGAKKCCHNDVYKPGANIPLVLSPWPSDFGSRASGNAIFSSSYHQHDKHDNRQFDSFRALIFTVKKSIKILLSFK